MIKLSSHHRHQHQFPWETICEVIIFISSLEVDHIINVTFLGRCSCRIIITSFRRCSLLAPFEDVPAESASAPASRSCITSWHLISKLLELLFCLLNHRLRLALCVDGIPLLHELSFSLKNTYFSQHLSADVETTTASDVGNAVFSSEVNCAFPVNKNDREATQELGDKVPAAVKEKVEAKLEDLKDQLQTK
ncbi:hypothetical protein ZIOFF_004994 [Zingiber officinale]|uniref:Uncharacterized protein n=1 Tax=Zingiber officinale TaxID=94328 RepID=A0A8J5HUW9_ZINOF|nr:hypothetical protein ZIOFF_004994 [Zingiber officinale]